MEKKDKWIEECSMCGKTKEIKDSYTPYGSVETDYGPEPLDERYICNDCWNKFYKEWVDGFTTGERNGDWKKSNAEIMAATKCGLKWSNGIGVLGSKKLWEEPFKYISKERYEELAKLPYWGYCSVCGSKREGGYCTNKRCENYYLN